MSVTHYVVAAVVMATKLIVVPSMHTFTTLTVAKSTVLICAVT